MSQTKIEELASIGQSIWLDSISREMITTGRLQGLIDKGLRGLTSNPTIFEGQNMTTRSTNSINSGNPPLRSMMI
jgi:transaldolase